MADPLERTRTKLLRRRERDLRALSQGRFNRVSSAAEPLREDLTQRREAYLMGTEGDWEDATMNAVDNRYIEEVASFGRMEGFEVIVADFAREYDDPTRLGANGSVRTFGDEYATTWTEDVGQGGVDGSLTLPPELDHGRLVARLREARAARAQRAASAGAPMLERYTEQGRLAQIDEASARMSFGVQTGRQMRLDLGYLERGNVLIGTKPNGAAFAIVGADSVALSRASIEVGFEAIGLAAPLVTGEMVTAAIAKDIGVEPRDVVVVEQPGTFHLDMAMTTWTPGCVLLNDIEAVQRLMQVRHGASFRIPQVQRIANMERMVAQVLRQAGLRVVRTPGRFPPSTRGAEDACNFFNGEGGIGAGASEYWITQHGPPAYVQGFVQALQRGGATVPRIHMISPEASRLSLAIAGGVNCRIVPLVAPVRVAPPRRRSHGPRHTRSVVRARR